MTKLLASVVDLAEAQLAVAGGADIVDLKNPSAGALGALPHATIRQVCGALSGVRPISATIGDLPADAGQIIAAIEATAACGVDFVKVGLFSGGDTPGVVSALQTLADSIAIVIVLFADQDPDFSLISNIAASGCRGVMLDTAGKSGSGLRQALTHEQLFAFISAARKHGLMTGLAGSLTVADIAPLRSLEADYLGFRGALCDGGRTGKLNPACLASVRGALPADQRRAG